MLLDEKEEVWRKLQFKYEQCQLCTLSKWRNRVVLGHGNLNAKVMFISDKTGYYEDHYGVPMQGEPGKKYLGLLACFNKTMDDVWTTNSVCCMTPDKRDPFNPELDACRGRLVEEIRLVDPNVIVIMGAVTARSLLGVRQGISKIQKRTFIMNVPGVLVEKVPYLAITTYNPAVIVRRPSTARGQPTHYMHNVFEMAFMISDLVEEGYEQSRIEQQLTAHYGPID